jgi:hypothetical protein
MKAPPKKSTDRTMANARKALGGSGDQPTRFTGLAKQAVKDKQSGKPSWLSPEQWLRKQRGKK